MLLGKRQRPPMKRTTSMTEVTFDLNTDNNNNNNAHEVSLPTSDPHNPFNNYYYYPKQQPDHGPFSGVWGPQILNNGGGGGGGNGLEGFDQRLLTTATPGVSRRQSVDFMETPNFLRSCGLCRRRLVPGRDIYMYRGDTAFCSLECRQQEMNQDEKKDKCSIASKKQAVASSAAGSVVSAKGETVAAV
ncbi:hypothetical protein PTKIN_Ptkin01aG0038200 [Pterospermum kingtungense]